MLCAIPRKLPLASLRKRPDPALQQFFGAHFSQVSDNCLQGTPINAIKSFKERFSLFSHQERFLNASPVKVHFVPNVGSISPRIKINCCSRQVVTFIKLVVLVVSAQNHLKLQIRRSNK